MLLSYTAKAQVAQSIVDTNFVNPGSIVKVSAQSVDNITVAYNWYVNGVLKKAKDSLNSFTDTIINDSRIKVVPISDSGAIGDTLTTFFSVHIPERIEWASTLENICLVNDTSFTIIPVGINLLGYTLNPGETYNIVYNLINQNSGTQVFTDSAVLNSIAATINIDSKKLGIGNFILSITDLYYGKDTTDLTHIDYTFKPGLAVGNTVSIKQTIKVGLIPVIGKIKIKNY
jgi:hypothetical protein